ncbi:MAG: hypothetical protein AAB573_01455 [Patescibacteria group bacterium]
MAGKERFSNLLEKGRDDTIRDNWGGQDWTVVKKQLNRHYGCKEWYFAYYLKRRVGEKTERAQANRYLKTRPMIAQDIGISQKRVALHSDFGI